jgi:hypothetical protein
VHSRDEKFSHLKNPPQVLKLINLYSISNQSKEKSLIKKIAPSSSNDVNGQDDGKMLMMQLINSYPNKVHPTSLLPFLHSTEDTKGEIYGNFKTSLEMMWRR